MQSGDQRDGGELAALIDMVPVVDGDERLSAGEFINLQDEEQVTGCRTVLEVLEDIQQRDRDAEAGPSSAEATAAEDDPDEAPSAPVSLDSAKRMAAQLLQFLGDNTSYFTERELQNMRLLSSHVDRMSVANTGHTRQAVLTSFFQPMTRNS